MTCAGNCRHGECAKCDQWRKAYANFHTTHSPQNSKRGGSDDVTSPGKTTQTTTCRGDEVAEKIRLAREALATLDDMTPEQRAFQLIEWALGAEFKP